MITNRGKLDREKIKDISVHLFGKTIIDSSIESIAIISKTCHYVIYVLVF